MFLKRLLTFLQLLALSLVIIVTFTPEWPAFQDERHRLDTIVGQRHFDFLAWETGALATKAEAILAGGHTYLDEETRKQIVLTTLRHIGALRRLTSEISDIYADPSVEDPDRASTSLRLEADRIELELEQMQPVAEAIVQEQVARILIEEGFGILGHAWPPVQMHMTPLPLIMVVSPRDEIRQIRGIPLQHGLSIADQDQAEDAVLEMIDRSGLVVPIGGLGMFPAMIVETSNINFLADVTAHEWAHHWLSLHPLGLNYLASPALRTINETVASVVGTEIGAHVIERYYPEFSPDPSSEEGEPQSEGDPKAFDFNAEMRETRVRVDELLAEGRVSDAEQYMEERRQFFWDNGFRIRKLNQAYFAFYGAYAEEPGRSGDDPTGPMLLALREESASLRAFMDQVAPITSLEQLQQIAAG